MEKNTSIFKYKFQYILFQELRKNIFLSFDLLPAAVISSPQLRPEVVFDHPETCFPYQSLYTYCTLQI